MRLFPEPVCHEGWREKAWRIGLSQVDEPNEGKLKPPNRVWRQLDQPVYERESSPLPASLPMKRYRGVSQSRK